MNRAVLGSGLAGLITGYLLGWPVIGENIGGQAKAPFPLGPRILEADEYSSKLLELLGIKKKPRVFRVGYIYSNSPGEMPRVHLTPHEGFKEAYYRKTRGDLSPITTSSMSDDKRTIVGWDIDSINLLYILSKNVPVRRGIITVIFVDDVTEIILGERTVEGLCYSGTLPIRRENIVNTLPLPVFLRLSNTVGVVEKPEAGDVRFVKVRANDPNYMLWFKDINRDYDYAYIADENMPIHRVTKIPSDTLEFIAEVNEPRYPELEVMSEFKYSLIEPIKGIASGIRDSALRIARSHVVKGSQILNSYPGGYDYVSGIKMVGRYAKWNHSVKLNHVIREAMELAEQMGRSFER